METVVGESAIVAKEKTSLVPGLMNDDRYGETVYHMLQDASTGHTAIDALAKRARRQYEPEIALLEAILQDAMLVMHAEKNKKNKELKIATRAWFMSDDSNSVFSFVNICEALHLAHTAVRRGVLSSSLMRKMYRKSDSYWKRQKRGAGNLQAICRS